MSRRPGRAPVVAAWGAGANSTAMIVELVRRGEPPDTVLLAAMPEQPRTRPLIPLFRDWMDAHGVPNEIAEYKVTRCKHWPPYNDLLEACLTNGTLPSIAFGLHACSARHGTRSRRRTSGSRRGRRRNMHGAGAARSCG